MVDQQIVYDLSLGFPDISVVPRESLAELTGELIRCGQSLLYGLDMRGARPTREQVAAFLSAATGMEVNPSDLLITNGALQAIDLACRALTRPQDMVAVEAPTFHDALRLLRLNNVEVVGVPLRQDGIDLDMLRALLERYPSRLRLLYVIPSYQNPTGVCTSATHREQLVELARQYDFVVLEDATYHFHSFEDTPPSLLKCFDDHEGHVITIGSFSKILAPALRQGWIWARPNQIQCLTRFKSDGCTSLLTSAILAEYLKRNNVDAHLQYLRSFYAQKCARMARALELHFSSWASWTVPRGGFFIWVSLLPDLSAEKLRAMAQARGVDFLPGRLCFPKPVADRYLRLCFAHLHADALEVASAFLGECLFDLSQQ